MASLTHALRRLLIPLLIGLLLADQARRNGPDDEDGPSETRAASVIAPAPERAVAASLRSTISTSPAVALDTRAVDEREEGVLDELQAARVLTAINRVRSRAQICGDQSMPAVGPVRWDAQASRAAQMQAVYLQRHNQFGHLGPEGSHVGERLNAAGLRWRKAGENLAAGHTDIDEVVSGWLASPSHCRVLMTQDFDLAGLALVPGRQGNTYASYWALVMAAPRSDDLARESDLARPL